MQWKCTKCCEMVDEADMETHKCSVDHNLMPSVLRSRPGGRGGCNLTGQVAGALELIRLRAEQREWNERREAADAAKGKGDDNRRTHTRGNTQLPST